MKSALLCLSADELQASRRCAELVSVAYDMYAQWEAQGRPCREACFDWTPPDDPELTFSTPLWSALRHWLFRDAEPFGFACRDPQGNAWLVFRGTESFKDWIVDGDADQAHLVDWDFGEAHHGFVDLYQSMRQEVMHVLSWLSPIRTLTITGHSLGCGLSTLAAPDIVSTLAPGDLRHVSFASPRVGSVAFARHYASVGVPTLRFVNSCDLVPQMPLPVAGNWLYEHVGTPVEFSANYGSVVDNHNLDRSYRYALEHPDLPCADDVAATVPPTASAAAVALQCS